MKKKDVADLKTKPVAELEKLLTESRAKLLKLKLEHIAGRVKNTREIREVRKSIARALTFIAAAGNEGTANK